jgi:hypothetical protein
MSDVVLRDGLQPCERSRTNVDWSLHHATCKQLTLIVILGQKRTYFVLYDLPEIDNVAKKDVTPFIKRYYSGSS